ncbi:MAG TPA: carboxypeptidase-like regulatory domain-containing protein [Pyrinomonadaceae bacterium]|nr:carboxypeptidase-like regulatory domain-containing protein [Pyrinomonadaceae bacterium]
MKQSANHARTRRPRLDSYKRWTLLVACVGVVTLFSLDLFTREHPAAAQRPAARRGPLVVRGYIAATVERRDARGRPIKSSEQEIYLPGVSVYLKNASGGDETRPVMTDLSGRFTLYAPQAGRYRVCWRADGFESDCAKETTVAAPVFLSIVRIKPDRRERSTVVYGKVKMKDGTRARRLEPLANINAFARVELLDAGGRRVREAYVNNFDEYLLPGVPARQEFTLRARIEGAQRDHRVLPAANIGAAPFHPISLVIDNSRPNLDPLVATDRNGRRVKVARPGQRVSLKQSGSDRDGDPLKLRWMVFDGSGTLSANDGPAVEWQLPDKPGLYTVKLIAWDGKGGYATSDLSLRTSDEGIPFSGQVTGTDAPAVADAEVEVNGRKTRTDARGRFNFRVPDARRFVLNIRKTGYGLVSRIYDDSVTGAQWTMTRASTQRFPTSRQRINVTERRDPRNCPGPEGDRLDWRRYASLLARPQWQDGKGNVIAPAKYSPREVPLPKPREGNYQCGPGATVAIPAGALRDKNGRVPSGSVDVSITSIDLRSPEQMPGDYTVAMPNGTTRAMESYGAVSIDIRSGTSPLNLRPGTTARLTLPVDPAQLAAGGSPPATIPLLFYDERAGVWRQEGNATLSGNAYVANLRHFSTINVDLIKTNQACVRIISEELPENYDLEYTIPSPSGGGAAPIVQRVAIDNDAPQEHVIYNLPTNTNIVLVPIRQDNNDTPIGVFVVNTGGQQNPTSPNLPAGPSYLACSTTVELTDEAVAEPTEEFLQGLYSFEATNLGELIPGDPTDDAIAAALDQASADYYKQIDPRDKRLTLDQFKTVNGFDNPPEVRASFANGGDLGFGRDMHCKQQLASDNLFDVACYVTNYGNILTDDQTDADDALTADASAGSPSPPVATVAMEYSRIENPPGDPNGEFTDTERVVKFYVYNSAGTGQLRAADLDSGPANLRPRPIPQLCMVCHNGVYPSGPTAGVPTFDGPEDTKFGSRFLPFDTRFYVFPSALDKTAQAQAIKDLNDLVSLTHTQEPTNISATAAIPEMITGMYTPPPPLPEQDENFVVTGWDSQPIQRGVYRDVVARTCRTCHVANIFGASPPNSLPIVFDKSSDLIDVLGRAESRVCTQRVMPHAAVTYRIFWTSTGPSMPAQFQVFGDTFDSNANGWNGTLCGDFTPGAGTPANFYTTNIQPIWDGIGTGGTACTACHTGGASAPEGLDLSSGASFGLINNVNSSELPSMKRVEPGNAAQSYLFHKVNGTHGSLAGCPNITSCFGGPSAPCGGQMPCGGPMNAAAINAIQDWINHGASGP